MSDWDSIRVSKTVKARAKSIRDMLLKHGESVLPERWRGRIEVPPSSTPRSVAARKLGVGQILDLALSSLERDIERHDSAERLKKK